jgi:hypothetical protein
MDIRWKPSVTVAAVIERGGLFQSFTGTGLCRRFAWVQVARRVVQAQALRGVLLDQ